MKNLFFSVYITPLFMYLLSSYIMHGNDRQIGNHLKIETF